MSKEIDWGKAPTDATHYLPGDDDNHECWLKSGFAVRLDRNSHDWFDDFSTHRKIEEGLAIPRPTTPSWAGEGLPPVGVVCEANFVGEWKRFEMRYYGEAHVVFKTAFEVQRARYDFDTCGVKFRPIRTPEQIAADEREAACEEMLEIAKSRRPDPDVYEAIATLYDAGFRKP